MKIDNSNIFEIKGSWNIINYHHSFEHVPDPADHMKKVYELLRPNGVCILRIPTFSSFAWEFYGVMWAQHDSPRHFFLHSINSIRMLGEKFGKELYKTVYDSKYFQFSGCEKYVNDIPLSAPRPKGYLKWVRRKTKKWQYKRRAILLNKEDKGDQAAFFF